MMKGGLAGLMKQAQQMQENMKKMQEELATHRGRRPVGRGHGQSDDDLPSRREARDDRSESLLDDDKDMLEDLVAAAMNDAVRRAEATTQEKMGGMTAGMRFAAGHEAAVLRSMMMMSANDE